MKHLLSSLALMAACMFGSSNSQAQTYTTTQTHSIDDYYKYAGPDIDLQGGVGYNWETSNATNNAVLGMGRARVGFLYVLGYPWAVAGGPTLELNTTTSPVWGIQAEVMNIGAGLWFRGGGGMDYNARSHYNMAVGWSVFGVEVDGFGMGYDGRSGVAVMGTVRFPLGYLLYVFGKH